MKHDWPNIFPLSIKSENTFVEIFVIPGDLKGDWGRGGRRAGSLPLAGLNVQTEKKEKNEKEKKDKKTALLWKPLTLFGPGWGHILTPWHVFM